MSQIRPSEINELFDRVRKRGYRHYLYAIDLQRLRGFKNSKIRFDFPVTALVGANGAGKTTVLGAAGLIYEEVQPRRFFARSGTYDDSMNGWRVEYDVLADGATIPRTASYSAGTTGRSKWNRKAVARPVKVIGVNRTLPVSEKTESYQFAKGDFVGVNEENFQEGVVQAVERILGKDAANYLRVDADKDGKYSILAHRSDDPDLPGYSEFHFGAGEASIIRIVGEIESVQDNALILVEEVENGLHPIATQRLVEYFVEVCRRKGCQVIFTTHSNAALRPLPGDAVWSAYRGELTQGKLDIESLRALTGQIDARLAIFAEDKFGALVAEVTLRRYMELSAQKLDLKGITFHSVGGAAPARDQARFNNSNPASRFPAVALLDGDKSGESGYEATAAANRTKEDNPFLSFIPGESSPEDMVTSTIQSMIDSDGRVLPKLTLALQLDTAQQEKVSAALEESMRLNRDRHTIFREIGDFLDFLSEDVTARAFVSTWANFNDQQVLEIWDPVKELLPMLDDAA